MGQWSLQILKQPPFLHLLQRIRRRSHAPVVRGDGQVRQKGGLLRELPAVLRPVRSPTGRDGVAVLYGSRYRVVGYLRVFVLPRA